MNQETYNQAIGRYLIGGGAALALSIIGYLAIVGEWFGKKAWLGIFLLVLAIVQLIVQLYAFLRLGAEKRPRLRNATFVFTILLLIVIVGGSLWIMGHLNYRMMVGPQGSQDYMIEQNKKGF